MKNQTSIFTIQLPWYSAGTWTSAMTTPAVDARSVKAVKAVTHVIEIPNEINSLLLRFTGTADNDSEVVDILVARDDTDTFTRIATATITIGKQQKGSVLLADTIVLSSTSYPTNKIEAISDADDYQASIWIDLLGHRYVAIVPTTVNGTLGCEYSGA